MGLSDHLAEDESANHVFISNEKVDYGLEHGFGKKQIQVEREWETNIRNSEEE